MMSPTADLNTTLALALMVFMLIQVAGLKFKGPGFLKHFVQPIPFLLPLTIIEEITKPVTLSLRLYGNIYAGEMLIACTSAYSPVVAFCGVLMIDGMVSV
jgi:F-type H+-transporting ATPase subunit a